MTIEELVIREQQRLIKEKDSLERQLISAPSGTLTMNKNISKGKTYYKWYISDNRAGRRGKRIYLRRQEKELAKKLARKNLQQARLKDINNELDALNAYLKRHQESCFLKKILQSPGFAQLLDDEILKTPPELKEDLEKWVHEDYESNPYYPEGKTVKTANGVMVRSKSEAIIYTLLTLFHIPFRYECRLDIGSNTYYPDFTIRHPITGECFYWEHVGMLDNQNYSIDFLNKLRVYIKHDIYPDHNLILTYEINGHPLDESIVMDKLKEFFFCDDEILR